MWQPTVRVLLSVVILFAAFAMSNQPTAVSMAAPAPVTGGSPTGLADSETGDPFAASLRHSGAGLARTNVSVNVADLSGLDGDALGNIAGLYNKFAAALLTGIAALVVLGGVTLSQLLRRRAHAGIWAHGGTDA